MPDTHCAQCLTQEDVEGIQNPGPEGNGMPTRTLDGVGQRLKNVDAVICLGVRVPTGDRQASRVLDPWLLKRNPDSCLSQSKSCCEQHQGSDVAHPYLSPRFPYTGRLSALLRGVVCPSTNGHYSTTVLVSMSSCRTRQTEIRATSLRGDNAKHWKQTRSAPRPLTAKAGSSSHTPSRP